MKKNIVKFPTGRTWIYQQFVLDQRNIVWGHAPVFILNKCLYYRYTICVECIMVLCITHITRHTHTQLWSQISFNKVEYTAIIHQLGLPVVNWNLWSYICTLFHHWKTISPFIIVRVYNWVNVQIINDNNNIYNMCYN